jgi:hypothetical protein
MKNPRNFLCPVCRRSYENYHIASDHWHKNHTDVGPVVPMPWAWSAEGARFLRRGPSVMVKHPQLRYADNPALPFDPMFGKTKEQISRLNPVGACDPTMVNPSPGSSHHNGFFIPDNNTKLGKIWNFGLPRGLPKDTGGKGTCVAASPWCRAACYGKGGQYQMHSISRGDPSLSEWYGGNFKMSKLPDFPERMIATLTMLGKKSHPRVMRLHPVGDFYSIKYIKDWITIARAMPDWKFYTYTRTWRVKAFLPYLNELRSVPNFNLLASTDPSLPPSPMIADWQECGVNVTYKRGGVPCRHDTRGTKCIDCGICYEKGMPSLFIKAHSLNSVGKEVDALWTAKRIARFGFNPKGLH